MPEEIISPEERFVNKILDDINYFQMEWDLSLAQIIGCMQMINHEILTDIARFNRERQEGEEDESGMQ